MSIARKVLRFTAISNVTAWKFFISKGTAANAAATACKNVIDLLMLPGVAATATTATTKLFRDVIL